LEHGARSRGRGARSRGRGGKLEKKWKWGSVLTFYTDVRATPESYQLSVISYQKEAGS